MFKKDLPRAHRSPAHPILEPRQETKYWWEANGIFNAGVADYRGRVVLLYRAYDQFRISRLGYAESEDGVHFTQRDLPAIDTKPDDEYERICIEDPRITQIGDTYYVVHTSASYYEVGHKADVTGVMDYMPWRVRVGLHSTKDFKKFKHHGVILNDIPAKNGMLLPEKINGQFALYYRQHIDGQEFFKIAFSADLKEWGGIQEITWPHPEEWQRSKFGLGSQPIATPEGFLLVYHAVDAQQVYRLGLALFDRTDPTKMIWHSGPILEPTMPYEKEGFIPNVVYTCGALIRNEELWIYYGSADRVIGRAMLPLKDIL